MLLVVRVSVALLLMSDSVLGHSWYAPECCSGYDCKPVSTEDVVETDEGWKYLPTGNTFTKDQVRPSEDRNYHVCIGPVNHKSYCIYIVNGM